MAKVELYDTTLRDGAQMEGISLSVEDKVKIALKLDELGVRYIEGGWPGSNPKDAEFFQRARNLKLKHACIVSFGSTRRAKVSAEQDTNLLALLEAQTPVVTLVGKSWDLHVLRVLETTLEENLNMIADSVAFLCSRGKTTFYDAEHFFDGFKENPDYALATIVAAADAGAECIILCDTNGGSVPGDITAAVNRVKGAVKTPLGIHAHNDTELAVANSLAAVQAGVVQVQGTINGYGERCGNANLCSVIANLKLKMGVDCVTDSQLARLTEVSRYVSEIANMVPGAYQPYVGGGAFTHKAGLHASAVAKVEGSYQHIPPEKVGNIKRVLVSELAGRSNILYKARELGIPMPADDTSARRLLEHIKKQESKGFQYDGAEASFDLLLRRAQKGYVPPFEQVDFMVVVEKRRRGNSNGEETLAEATVKVKVGNETFMTAAEGNGPVNALDAALRKALLQFYPEMSVIKLVDYKVRIIDETSGTGAGVRVLIESTDGIEQWRTVGSSPNIIEASWLALTDSLEYWLVRHRGS